VPRGTVLAEPARRGSRRDPPEGWRLVLLIGSLSIFGPLCIDMYLPAFPAISRDLHASASAVQLTLTACLVGISAGQLLFGPVSDRRGRRAPLLVGLGAFVLSSLACAVARNIALLVVLRLVQGLGGAAGIVIARSIVRDLHSGVALARFFSTLMLATGLGPVLAPQFGSWVLSFTTWRGIFGALALLGVVLLVSAWWRIPETLPPERRQAGSLADSGRVMWSVVRDRTFLGYTLACGLGMGATFAYVAGSSFVLQNVYGLSPQVYGLVFALNALGMIVGAQVNGTLVGRLPPSVLLTGGLVTMGIGGWALLTIVLTGAVGLPGVIPALVVVMFGNGFVATNALALALHRYPGAAGAASAVIGSFQFVMAAVIAPLPGVAGTADAIPMAVLIATLPPAALASRALLTRTARPAPGGDQPPPEPVVARVIPDHQPGARPEPERID
jgi:DHA1 family bicyclomycin/chloramphenicol resistance-like MFS transporter